MLGSSLIELRLSELFPTVSAERANVVSSARAKLGRRMLDIRRQQAGVTLCRGGRDTRRRLGDRKWLQPRSFTEGEDMRNTGEFLWLGVCMRGHDTFGPGWCSTEPPANPEAASRCFQRSVQTQVSNWAECTSGRSEKCTACPTHAQMHQPRGQRRFPANRQRKNTGVTHR